MDITEEAQTRAALQQTRRREMAAQLTSGLAQDFSNLLTIILGMQSKLQRMDLPEEVGGLIAATISAARRGGTLLNRIADMTGVSEHEPRPTNLPLFFDDPETLALSTLPEGVTLSIHDLIDGAAYRLDPGGRAHRDRGLHRGRGADAGRTTARDRGAAFRHRSGRHRDRARPARRAAARSSAGPSDDLAAPEDPLHAATLARAPVLRKPFAAADLAGLLASGTGAQAGGAG